MAKFFKIFLIFLLVIIFFNKKIVSFYYTKKFSKWVERPVKIESIDFKYSGLVEIKNIEINNKDAAYYKNIFKAEKIILFVDLKSFLSDLIIIKNLDIINPNFFLDLKITKKENNSSKKQKDELLSYEDNIGLAQKINDNTPDKIWPNKNRDVNFIILESNLLGAKTNINVSFISQSTQTQLSEMKFTNFGNEKEYQHYKDVLKFILFDAYASTKNLK